MIAAVSFVGTAHAGPLTVFVSILPQKYFVERIAGHSAHVVVMVGPGDSPASYEPSPRQVAALSGARVYFEIGVPFEHVWMTRIRAANPDMLIVDTVAGIERRRIDGPADTTSRTVLNDPHLWTNPALVKAMAVRIRDTFSRIDRTHAEQYERNYRKFANDLDNLDAEIRARLAPFAGQTILVFHASWGYFADAYGLRQIAIEAAGKEPGPKTLANDIDEAKALGITVVFVQPQFSRANAQMIARELGGRVVVVDPLAENYIDNLRRVATSFAQAMSP